MRQPKAKANAPADTPARLPANFAFLIFEEQSTLIKPVQDFYTAHPDVRATEKTSEPAAGCEGFGVALSKWSEEHWNLSCLESFEEEAEWRRENPEEAAEDDRMRAERAAATAKRLKQEAKNPDKAKAKALDAAIKGEMSDDMDEAKQEAREAEEEWSEMKDDWIADWKSDNWDETKQAEFEKDFGNQWHREHGASFPESRI